MRGRRQAIVGRVGNAAKVETLCRGSHAGLFAVSGNENGRGPVAAFAAIADGKQGADDVAHHVVQKGVTADIHCDPAVRFADVDVVDAAPWGFRLAFGGAEGAEVVFTNERLRGLVHEQGVEWLFVPMAALRPKRARLSAVADEVAVMAGGGAVTRMEVVSNGGDPLQADIGGQVAVRAGQPGEGAAFSTCAVACTPASVRPAQVVVMVSAATWLRARSICS